MSADARPGSPSLLSRVTRALARTTAPLSRPLAGRRFFPMWAVVEHRGRRSGRSYAVPVAIRATPDGFTIPLPWGVSTQWLRNVRAAGACDIRWRGVRHRATDPRVLAFAEAAEAFHPIQRAVLRAGGVHLFVRLTPHWSHPRE